MKITLSSLRAIIRESVDNEPEFLRSRASSAMLKAKEYSRLSDHQKAHDTFSRARVYFSRAAEAYLAAGNEDLAEKMNDEELESARRMSIHKSALMRKH